MERLQSGRLRRLGHCQKMEAKQIVHVASVLKSEDRRFILANSFEIFLLALFASCYIGRSAGVDHEARLYDRSSVSLGCSSKARR